MTRDQQRLADYLTHIQVAIERIHRCATSTNSTKQPSCKVKWRRMP